MKNRVGLKHFTGEPDSGKTFMALNTGIPIDNICFFDLDVKSKGIVRQIKESGGSFGEYHDLVHEFREVKASTPLKRYEHFRRLLDKIKEGQYEQIVFDNWSDIEDGIREYAEKVMTTISPLTPGQIKNMSQLTWPYIYRVYGDLLDEMLTKAPLVIVTTHIREKYFNNKKTGIFESRGQRPIIEKADLRIWLRHNEDPADAGAPIGLVLKRMNVVALNDGKIKPINALPRRIKPCTWERIDYYMENPIGDRKPTPDETPNEFEYSVLDGILTRDQMDAIRLARIESEREMAEERLIADAMKKKPEIDEETANEIKRLKNEEGKPIPAIAALFELTPAQVATVLNS